MTSTHSLSGRSRLSGRFAAGCLAVSVLLFGSSTLAGVPFVVLTSVLLGFMLFCAALSAMLAAPGRRQDAALCTLIGQSWAYAVGFAQYWSTAEWFYWVDTVIISAACVFAQTLICRGKSLLWLLSCTVLLVPPIMVSGIAGAAARSFEDPRM